jgi:hypothetical protein
VVGRREPLCIVLEYGSWPAPSYRLFRLYAARYEPLPRKLPAQAVALTPSPTLGNPWDYVVGAKSAAKPGTDSMLKLTEPTGTRPPIASITRAVHTGPKAPQSSMD